MINKILLISSLVLAMLVRVNGLDKSPPSINFDEAALGYNAYSILITGKDEYGISLPLSLRSFNDFKPALYAYLAIPGIKIWGLNDFTTRLPSAIMGTISLLWLYLIIRKYLSPKKYLFWIVWVLLIFDPWRLHYSRVAFESNVSMSFFTMGVYGLINFKKSLKNKIICLIGFGLACYSYHGARLAAPLLMGLYFIDPIKNWNELVKITFWKEKIFKLWPVVVLVIVMLPIFLDKRANLVLARFQQTNLFKTYYPFSPKEILENKIEPWKNFWGNPVYYLGGLLSGHVASYLSPHNWSLKMYHWIIKSPQVISSSGMIGQIESIFIPIGIGVTMWGWKKRKFRFLGYWILAGAAPAALTLNWFHPLRSLNMFPAIEIIIAMGIFTMIKKNWQKAVIGVLVLVQIIFNTTNEWRFSIRDTNGEFQPGGFKEGAPILKTMVGKYETIYIDSPHSQSYIFFLYYLNYPPKIVQTYAGIRPAPGTDGNLNFDFDKFKFKKYDWLKDRDKNSFIYFTSSEVIDAEIDNTSGARRYSVINTLGENPATIITKE